MLPILVTVVAISLSGVMMPGPMFAVTLAKSFKSPWAGAQLSLGHAVVEVPLILLIYFGFAGFFEQPALQLFLSVAGGSMIAWMGIAMFRARSNVVRRGKDLPYSAFVGGIMMTGLNPFFLLWWATVGGLLILRISEFGTGGLIAFTAVHWLTDLVWLSFISILVYRTHKLWGARFQEWVFIANSALLFGFGIWFVVSGVQMVV